MRYVTRYIVERGSMGKPDETRQFLLLSLGLLAVAVLLVALSIATGLKLGNYPLELSGYGLAVLAFVIVAALGGKENGKTENNKTEFEPNIRRESCFNGR